MALQILKNGESKLIIEGSNIELEEIYTRLSFALFADGLTMQGTAENFQSKILFESGSKELTIEGLEKLFKIDVDVAAGDQQGLLLGHEKIKAQLEAKGYIVNIVGLN